MRLLAACVSGLLVASLAQAGGAVIWAHGVHVVVPSGWQRVRAASAGAVTDPRTLLVVGTAGVRPKPSRCQIAAYRLPATGAAVVAVGWKQLALSGAQGEKAGRWPLKRLVAVQRPSFECFRGRGAVATLVLAGKAFQVNVLVANRASRRRIAEALAVARSFDVER